jgi:hypothetical protein
MSPVANIAVQAAILADASRMPELVDLRDANNKLVSRVTRAQTEAALLARRVDPVEAWGRRVGRGQIGDGTE